MEDCEAFPLDGKGEVLDAGERLDLDVESGCAVDGFVLAEEGFVAEGANEVNRLPSQDE